MMLGLRKGSSFLVEGAAAWRFSLYQCVLLAAVAVGLASAAAAPPRNSSGEHSS